MGELSKLPNIGKTVEDQLAFARTGRSHRGGKENDAVR